MPLCAELHDFSIDFSLEDDEREVDLSIRSLDPFGPHDSCFWLDWLLSSACAPSTENELSGEEFWSVPSLDAPFSTLVAL